MKALAAAWIIGIMILTDGTRVMGSIFGVLAIIAWAIVYIFEVATEQKSIEE